MKQSTSFLTRCLALVLALVLLVSNANLGMVLNVFAAGENEVVEAGVVVADNYELPEAEEALLRSGYMAGEVTFAYPDESWVDVDTESKTITAAEKDGWTAASAAIYVGDEKKEDVALTAGVGTYAYAENAFSVRVEYVLKQDIANQAELLTAAADLKTGVDGLKATYDGTDANLGTIVLALPTLEQLCGEGLTIDFMGRPITKALGADAQAAIAVLRAQVTANGDALDLQKRNAEYNAAASKVQYLVASGSLYKDAAAALYEALVTIQGDALLNDTLLDTYLETADPTSATQWVAFKGILGNVVAALKPAANTEWAILSYYDKVLDANADYAALDTLVAALGSRDAITPVEGPLKVAEHTVQANLSMFNVDVVVKLQTVNAENEVADADSYNATVTLAKDATAAEILAEIADKGIEEAALAAFGAAYIQEHFTSGADELPDTLVEDITYTITYSPKTYTVTFSGDYVGVEPMTVPYGYSLTLEKHSDSEKAYDYTVNGEPKTQGSVVTITGNTTVTRSTGKAYTSVNLYDTIAENYANPALDAILTSGALKNNQIFSVRQPDAADSASLVTLSGTTLTAKSAYPADYAGLSWVPYTYGTEGTENTFGGVYNVTVTDNSVKVKYRLELTNFTAEQVKAILDNAAGLKEEADAQVEVLDRLTGYHSQMGQLDKTKLGALNGVIDVTDLHTDPAKNEALKAEFKSIVSGIIANNLDSNNYLKIYNMLGDYLDENTGGLRYYYNNAAALINEINTLSGYLTGMLADDDKVAALEILVTAAGFPEYAEKIANLENAMAEVKRDLTAPNALIDLESENLYKLIDALVAEGEPSYTAYGSPYMDSVTLTAADENAAYVQIFVTANGKTETFTSPEYKKGDTISAADLQALIATANNYAATQLGSIEFYAADNMAQLQALATKTLDQQFTNVYLTYAPISYTVKVEGAPDQTVTVEKLQITLPKHASAGYVYEYTVFGREPIEVNHEKDASIILSVDELRQIAAGTNTIARKEIHKAAEDLEEDLEKAAVLELIKDADGNLTGIIANVDPSKDSLMGFANEMIKLGAYIELNDEVLLETTDSTQVSIQTLLNAVLDDNSFGSQTLIDLNTNNGGVVFTGTLDVGDSAESITIPGLDFTFKLKSVPAQMADVAKALDAVKPYMSFQSKDGVLDLNLNLPEKIYEVYLTAMLATSDVNKADMNAINNEIAFMFLYDYIEVVMQSDATTQSFQNTLDKLYGAAGKITDADLPDVDLTQYESYYQLLKKGFGKKGASEGYGWDYEFKSTNGSDDVMDLWVRAVGKSSINKLLGLLGLDPESFIELAMIKEYKEGNDLTLNIDAVLANTEAHYEAVLIDVRYTSDAHKIVNYANKFDYTPNLAERLQTVKGGAVVMLLDDVEGNLTFNGTTILDLNGKTVTGNIVSNANLYIFDSSMSTAGCGGVTGTVSGNAVIVAGKYPGADVTAFLPDGYEEVNDVVQNVLYTIETTADSITFVVNTDVMDKEIDSYFTYAKALAADIALDLAMNFYPAAALSANNHEIYNVSFFDLIGMLDDSGTELVNELLSCISMQGTAEFINDVMVDLLNFGAMETALLNNDVIASYDLSAAPWIVEISHVADGDYMTCGFGANTDAAANFSINLVFDGKNNEKIAPYVAFMDDIVLDDTYVKFVEVADLTFADKHFNLSGGVDANIVLDLSDYDTYVAILLANGTTDAAKAEAIVTAVNSGYHCKLQDAFDAMSVKDVFDALKVLNRNDDFATLASNVGITVEIEPNEKIEKALVVALSAAGKVLEEHDIIGRDSVMGSLDTDNDGIYELSASASKQGTVTKWGYGVNGTLTKAKLTVKADMIGECEPLGDVDGNGVVNPRDAMLVAQYYGKLPVEIHLCVADVDVNGVVNPRDAMLIAQYYGDIVTELPYLK